VVFSPLLEGGTTHLAVMIIRLLILLLLGVYLWNGITAGVLTRPSLQIGPAVLAFLGLSAISTATSPYTHQSLQWLIVLLSYATLLYLLVCFLGQWDHIAKLLAAMVGMGLFEAGWAIIQAGWFDAIRPSGTFFNPNFLAGYLAAVLSLVLGVLCYTKVSWAHWWLRRHRIEGEKRVPRISGGRVARLRLILPVGMVALLTLLLLAIVFTGSRGGLLALLIGTVQVVVVRFGRKGVYMLLLPLLICLLLPNPLRDRIYAEHVNNPVGYARWQMWQSSVREIADYPFGIGLGLYQYTYPQYAFPVEGQIARYGKVAQTPHNEYLQMGVELGVASMIIFGWGVALVAREAAQVLKRRLRRWQRGVLVGVSGGIAGILTHAAFDSNLHEPALAILLTLYVGILLSARRLSAPVAERACTVPVRPRWLWGGLAVALVMVLAAHFVRLGLAWGSFERGYQAFMRHDFVKAISEYQGAVALDPGKALYHSSLAAGYSRLFERNQDLAVAEAAVAELRSAIALNPLDGRLFGQLGHAYMSLSLLSAQSGSPSIIVSKRKTTWLLQALSAYREAAKLEPFTASYLYELGRVYLALGDRQTVAHTVRRAVELEPNFLRGRELLARVYLEMDQTEAATQEYLEIIERQRRYAAWSKDPIEEHFLNVDVATLRAELERRKLHT